MRRILVVHWPTARRTPGNSLGPIAINATAPITNSSLQPTSNIALLTPRGALPAKAGAPLRGHTLDERSADLAGLGLRRRLRRLVVDRLRRLGLLRLRFRGLVLGHALLEGLDALRDVAHQLGDLSAAEHQQDDGDDDDPVPNTQRTH